MLCKAAGIIFFKKVAAGLGYVLTAEEMHISTGDCRASDISGILKCCTCRHCGMLCAVSDKRK